MFEEWASPLFAGIWECAEPIDSLTEKGVSARLDGVGVEQAVEARSIGSGAEECEDRDGQSADKKESVSPVGVGDADLGQPESEVRGFSVAKGLFNREATGVEVDELAKRFSDEAGGEAAGLLHSFFFDADDSSDGKVLGGDESGLDFLGASAGGTPGLGPSLNRQWVLQRGCFV